MAKRGKDHGEERAEEREKDRRQKQRMRQRLYVHVARMVKDTTAGMRSNKEALNDWRTLKVLQQYWRR